MFLTWNASGLCKGKTKELALCNLLQTHSVDIAAITEAELDDATASNFSIDGYTTFLPLHTTNKVRVLLLVRTSLAIAANARQFPDSTHGTSIWLELNLSNKRFLVGGVYRPWKGVSAEADDLHSIIEQVKVASNACKAVVVLGDFNLDTTRKEDPQYSRRQLLSLWLDGIADAGLQQALTGPTWTSYGTFGTEKRTSTIDHIYFTGLELQAHTLDDATTDHRPLLAMISIQQRTQPLKTIHRRNFKAVRRQSLEAALEEWPWAPIYELRDVEKIHNYLLQGITASLDKIAPCKAMKVQQDSCIYLTKETRRAMAARDAARNTRHYRTLRNRVTSLVRRDKIKSNLQLLKAAKGDPKKVWSLANKALGKAARAPLPVSITVNNKPTTDSFNTAQSQNKYYIEKVDRLRATMTSSGPVLRPARAVCTQRRRFEFSFTTAAKISRIIKRLKNTGALGNDGIPVSILKQGVSVLSSPIAHLVNMSLSSGHVPIGFKKGIIIPIFKGKGKSSSDPSSYRPVSLLPALSKVLETVVKEDLDRHLLSINALPNSQYGFRKGRSTSTAISAAHGSWTKAVQAGKVVGILAFDFSAAFDTVDPKTLLLKLSDLGIKGKELDWFQSYLTGGQQCVDWNGTRSNYLPVKYGVRQGSILGPLLFITLMSDLPCALSLSDDENGGYADDSFLWATGKDAEAVRRTLNEKAQAFVEFAQQNGLSLNANKTQLLLAGRLSNSTRNNFSVEVGQAVIHPSSSLELLGVRFDSKLSPEVHVTALAKSIRQRASLMTRLANHLPRGHYMRLLAQGLICGKLSYGAAAAITPRLPGDTSSPSGAAKAIQVAVNDIARTLTGHKRTDHVPVPTLLSEAELPSLNQVAVRALAIETWKAYHSSDGPDRTRNPLGAAIFCENPKVSNPKLTRSKTEGQVSLPLPLAASTMVYNAAKLWNQCQELRNAKTLGAAKSVAKSLAKTAPL